MDLNYLTATIMQMMSDWPLGTIIALVIIGSTVILICLAMLLLLWAIDSWFLPRKNGTGQIVGKNFTPAHEETTLVMIGKVLVPRTIDYPDEWSLRVEVDGRQDTISVSQGFFVSLQVYDWIRVSYGLGRLTDNLYLKEISR